MEQTLWGVPLWVLVLVAVVAVVALSSTRDARVVKRVERLPLWFCAFVAAGAWVGVWYLWGVLFGNSVFIFHL